MSDKKMITRNCPAILKMTKVCDDYRTTRDNPELCKNINDCVMKQIVDLCKRDKNFCINCKAKADDNIDCIECIEGGRAELGTEILKLLDIQEAD